MLPRSTFQSFTASIERNITIHPTLANSIDKIDPSFRCTILCCSQTGTTSQNWSASSRKIPDPPCVTCTSAECERPIQWNRAGKRVDSHTWMPENILNTIKLRRPKLCNNFHLKRQCPYGHTCGYSHEWLCDMELMVLREVAKEQPCRNGSGCDDPDCYAGHRCTLKHKAGEQCRFPREMHFEVRGIELTPFA